LTLVRQAFQEALPQAWQAPGQKGQAWTGETVACKQFSAV